MLLNIRPVPAPTLTNLTATPSIRAVVLLWDMPTDPTYAGAEIWSNAVNNVSGATKIGKVTTNTFTDTSSGVNPAADRYYWVRAVNIYGRTDGVWSNSAVARSVLAINLDIAAGAVQASNLAVAAIDSVTGNLAAGAVQTANFASSIQPVSIVSALPAASGYTGPKVVFLTADGKMYRYSGGAWTTAIPSTDLTGQITGTQITDGSITTAKLGANAVTAGKIQAGTITSNEIAADTITAGNIAAGAVTASEIAAGAVTAGHIASRTITATQIAVGAITANEIAANTITSAQIWSGYVYAGSIAASQINVGQLTASQIVDMRTGNYAEDGGGNPTAGAKIASAGTAIKVANNALQVGTVTFSDYWFRLVQAIDGNQANGRVIWRGNNDSTTRGGAPDIGRLSIYFISSQVLNSNFQQIYHGFKLTPSGYSTYTDNLDAMQQIHVQLFQSTSSSSPFTEFYWPCPSRTYDGASGIVQGSWSWGWRFSGAGSLGTISGQLESNGLFTGCMRVRLANSYGWSATQDFAGSAGVNQQLSTTTITGVSGSSGGGSGGTSSGGGGACPAPWVKVRLINGTEVNAGDLHDGAVVAAVNDSTFEILPKGGVIRECRTIWAQRYRVTLTDGRATEWSENHRFAVDGRGWVHVQNLRAGDQILGMQESIVQTVLAVGQGQAVSFRVDGAGTYFAGGLLCHNYKMLP
jgi:hypothetical protein